MDLRRLARSLAVAGRSYGLRVLKEGTIGGLRFDVIVYRGDGSILLALDVWSPIEGPVASSQAFRNIVSKAYRLAREGFKVDFAGAYNGLYLAAFTIVRDNVELLEELSSVEGRTYVLEIRPSTLAYYSRFKPGTSSARSLIELLLKGSKVWTPQEALINDLDDLQYVIAASAKDCDAKKTIEAILESIAEKRGLDDTLNKAGCALDNQALSKITEWLHELLDSHGPLKLAEALGFLYERFMPASERRRSGIFYTPRRIVELIVKWAVDKPSVKVLDPGCGTGVFLLEAYRRARILCGNNSLCRESMRIVGVEVDPSSARIARLIVELASGGEFEPLVAVGDYFSLEPEELGGPFDSIIGNPPYTRWTMTPKEARSKVLKRLGVIVRRYGLTPDPKRGVEPGLHAFWIINSHRFLKEKGRLAMIISDSWMQSSHGKRFLEYLLDHFNLKAVIDLKSNPFSEPMVGACILFLEKKAAPGGGEEATATLVYVEGDAEAVDADDLLRVIDSLKSSVDHVKVEKPWGFLRVRNVSESVLREGRYNIPSLMLGVDYILEKLSENPLTVELSKYFDLSFSNITYLYLASKGIVRGVRNVGGETFFYLAESDARKLSLPEEYLYPLIPSPRHLAYFTFTRGDWERLRRDGEECYLFLAHRPRKDLPEPVKRYIEMGERGEKGLVLSKGPGRGKPVALSFAAKARERYPRFFYGWYDLGGVEPTLAYATYGSRYWIRFVMPDFNYALDNRIIAFIPKKRSKLSSLELKALLAYLNSSFTQLQAEALGRVAGGAALLEVDVRSLSSFMVIDVSRMDRASLYKLARLFDSLEAEARRMGGADTASSIYGDRFKNKLLGGGSEGSEGLFDTVISEIDSEVASILGLDGLEVEVREAVLRMASRRLARGRMGGLHLS